MDPSSSVGDLLRAARTGDQSAWNDLVDRFLPLVTGVIARHRLYGADAEDVNQTVWLRLVENLDTIREPNALPGWIATTVRHECLGLLRRRGRATPVDPSATGCFDRLLAEEDPDEELIRDERHEALRRGLGELSEQRRELLLLLLEDPPPSYAEINRRLGIPIGGIGPTRARAIDELRKTAALSALLTMADGPDLRR